MNKQIIPLNRGINKNGGAFWCQNIAPARDDGVYAGLSLADASLKSLTATSVKYYMRPIYGFAQIGSFDGYASTAIFGKDSSGDIHLSNYSGTYTCKCHSYGQSVGMTYKSICINPNGNLLYGGSRYLGKAFSTTLSATCAVAATSCSLTSTANIGASGYLLFKDTTTLTSEMVQYTGKSASGVTGLTKGIYNTTDRQHVPGTTVYFFDDDYKDFGAENATSNRMMKNWEDKTLIANGRYVATLDGDTLKTNALTLPTGYNVVDFGFVPTGSSSKILVCANKDEIGSIFVWDGNDDTYITQISLENISYANETFLATEIGVYECNGASINLFWRNPDSDESISRKRFIISDIKESGNYVLVAGQANSYIRGRGGLWIIDKKSGDSYFVAGGGLNSYTSLLYSIFPSSENFILLGGNYNGGSIQYLNNFPKANGSQYWYLFKPANAQTIKLKKIKLNVGTDTSGDPYPNNDFDFDVVVRYYDFTKPFHKRTQLKSGESETIANSLVVSDLCVPQVGDRVEIIQSGYSTHLNAGCPRNITAVTAGSGKYTLTLDEDLPAATTTTTYNAFSEVKIIPLKKAGKVSVNGNINMQDLTFYIPDQPEGKKFIFEIEVRCGHTSISPELNYMEVYYDILD
jgi:hypothetical protein